MVAFVLTYFVLDLQINKNPAIQKVVVALIACVTPLGAVGILAGFIFVVFGVSLFVLTLSELLLIIQFWSCCDSFVILVQYLELL